MTIRGVRGGAPRRGGRGRLAFDPIATLQGDMGKGKASPRGRLPPFVRRGDPRLRGDDKNVAGMTSANKALFWALFRGIS